MILLSALILMLGLLIVHPAEASAVPFDRHEQVGHTGHHAGDEGGLTVQAFLIYASRVVYYMALLIASGFLLWSALLKTERAVIHALLNRFSLQAARALLLSSLLYVFLHAQELMQGRPLSEWLPIFTQTNIGLSWSALLVLSLSLFLILRGDSLFKALWAMLLLAAESWNGHAIAAKNSVPAIVLDYVHLLASSIWVGGLLLLLVLWYQDRKEAGRFAETFTGTALLSMAVLILSGIGLVLLFLPSLSYLTYTLWGTLLLVKISLLLLVLLTGFLLRRRVKRSDLPNGKLLRLDVTLMAVILVIVGVFTFLTPIPANEPLYHHKMGDTMHLTLEISPNQAGRNEADIRVWLPEQQVPVRVELMLYSEDSEGLAPIVVQPKLVQDDKSDPYESFPGFTMTSYEAEVRIPSPGKWRAELIIVDEAGVKTTETVLFRNY